MKEYRPANPLILSLLITIFFLFSSGCASVPYHYGTKHPYGCPPKMHQNETQFEYGSPNSVIDGIGRLFSIPSKIILWDRRVDSHTVSSNTVERLEKYLDDNGLVEVKVRINQYDPLGELRRTFGNKSIGLFWRCTGGLITWLYYTFLPGRIIGGDNYNPFSHTINIYSDAPVIALHEGAHAKDFTGRKYKGWYAFGGILPLVPLYHEYRATGDVIGYLKTQGGTEEEISAYKILYPAYGTYVGGEISRFYLDPYDLFPAVLAIPGHIIGRIKAANVENDEIK